MSELHGTTGSISSEDVRPQLMFLYAYSYDQHDAVAGAIRELASALQTQGFKIEVPAFHLRAVSSSRRPVFRPIHQAWFMTRSALRIFTRGTRYDAIVTIDVPIGIGQVGELAHRLSRGRIRHVSWIMDLYSLQDGTRAKSTSSLRARLEKHSIRTSDIIVTLGTCMADRIRSATGRDAAVIPMWQDDTWLGSPSTSSLWRKANGISEQTKLLLYSGHAGENHPLGELIAAMAIARRDADVTLAIVGHGLEYERQKSGTTAGPPAGVLFFPPMPRDVVAGMLKSADIHVVSLREAMTGTCVPSKTYASMAAGRCVLFLGSQHSQAALDISAAGSGLVLPSATPAQIAYGLVGLCDHVDEISSKGLMGREFFLKERSLVTQSERWAAHLRNLLEAKTPNKRGAARTRALR